jgi:hypothetical protein
MYIKQPNNVLSLEPTRNHKEEVHPIFINLFDIQELKQDINEDSLLDFKNIFFINNIHSNHEKTTPNFIPNDIENLSDINNTDNNNELNEPDLILSNNSNFPYIEIEISKSENIRQKEVSESQPKREKKLLGRKKKNDESKRKHDKYKKDNMSIKIKKIVKEELLTLINSKIKPDFSFLINNKLYSGDGVKLLNITDENFKNTNVDYNTKLFKTKIRYILNDKISKKYKKYPENFNDKLIENIYDSEKGAEVREILDKTFLECLRYYRMDKNIYGNDNYACLSGLEKGFQKLSNKLVKDNKNDKEYVDGLINFMKDFETVYSSKKL